MCPSDKKYKKKKKKKTFIHPIVGKFAKALSKYFYNNSIFVVGSNFVLNSIRLNAAFIVTFFLIPANVLEWNSAADTVESHHGHVL